MPWQTPGIPSPQVRIRAAPEALPKHLMKHPMKHPFFGPGAHFRQYRTRSSPSRCVITASNVCNRAGIHPVLAVFSRCRIEHRIEHHKTSGHRTLHNVQNTTLNAQLNMCTPKKTLFNVRNTEVLLHFRKAESGSYLMPVFNDVLVSQVEGTEGGVGRPPFSPPAALKPSHHPCRVGSSAFVHQTRKSDHGSRTLQVLRMHHTCEKPV